MLRDVVIEGYGVIYVSTSRTRVAFLHRVHRTRSFASSAETSFALHDARDAVTSSAPSARNAQSATPERARRVNPSSTSREGTSGFQTRRLLWMSLIFRRTVRTRGVERRAEARVRLIIVGSDTGVAVRWFDLRI